MPVKRKSKRIGWIILVIAVALAGGAIYARPLLKNSGQASLDNVKRAIAETGTIEKTVSGTGNLSAENTIEDIYLEAGLKIDEVAVESGDRVKKGDVLATFDALSLQTAIWDTQAELSTLDARINQVRNKTESAYLLASVGGRIKQILVSEGDSVADTIKAKNALIVLSIDGKMRVTFTPALTTGLSGGDTVSVRLSDGTKITGTIESISQAACAVTLSDKIPPVNDAVTVTLKDGTTLGSGNLTINRPIAVTGSEGTVKTVLKNENDLVTPGTRLIQLEQGASSREYLRLASLRTEQADRLKTLLGYVGQNSQLTATLDGIIEKVTLSAGQTIGNMSAAAFTVKTKSVLKLVVNIDELDISAIAQGQKANVTLDALTGKTLAGAIIEIDDSGKSSQGGTSYAVTIDLPADPSLKQGMTATAVITVDRRENIVRIPLEALQESGKEQYVYIGTASSSTALGEKRVVTTGISDGTSVEIISGLNSGDGINFYYVDTSNNSLMPFGSGSRLTGVRNTTGAGSAAGTP